MADVRALLAAERQSRRITHPHLTYTKNGSLMCNICDLNIKSEQLWPGHLKSLNHRNNISKISEPIPRPTKRKIDNVEAADAEARDYEVDSRKKPKSFQSLDNAAQRVPEVPAVVQVTEASANIEEVESISKPIDPRDEDTAPPPSTSQPVAVDEDEWAAFEREVAPLAQPTYASATIEAAPISAAELKEQQKTNVVQQIEDEAEAEKEDESRRMEEEFEVMEEMEDRLKRLRARREALRTKDPTEASAHTSLDQTEDQEVTKKVLIEDNANDSTDDDEIDDWYK